MAVPESLWVDSDIILDHLADRQPWSPYATELLRRGESGEVTLFLSALSLSNIFYILRKHTGTGTALKHLSVLTGFCRVAPMNEQHVQQALQSGMSDFEDALQIAAAQDVPSLSAIITRNRSDYISGPLRVMTAEEWIAAHPRM